MPKLNPPTEDWEDDESLCVWDAADIWMSSGYDEDYMFGYTEEELRKAYEIVKQEALNSFNDDSIYIEKFIEN